MSSNTTNPKIIVLISGKRKCGKDFIAEKLKTLLSDTCTILRISEPIKKYYADNCGLSLSELLGNGPFKEQYRIDMIAWGENMRSKDPGCFCKIACESAPVTSIWIVSDIRRKTDVDYFRKTYGEKVKTVRIDASEDVRKNRGWIFTKDVDDAESECDLDDFQEWNLEVKNDDTGDDVLKKIISLLEL